MANIEKAQKSFKASGIHPFNRNQFDNIDFAPFLVKETFICSNSNIGHEIVKNIELDYSDQATYPNASALLKDI